MAGAPRMKQHQGVWLPDGETHLIEWMTKSGEVVDGLGTYQIKKFREAMKWVRGWRVAVDVGAHVGLWSMQLVKRFAHLHAFEPVAAHRDCFARNVDGQRVLMHGCALGSAPGMVAMVVPPSSSGGTHVDGAGDIEMRTLDSFGL